LTAYSVLGLAVVGALVFQTAGVSGQDFPSRPIRIVTGEAGGGSDFVSRLVAQGLTANLNQQVIVENRGGDASIPANIVLKAQPDGYTLLVGAATLWIGSLLQKKPYDPLQDFSPIAWLTRSTNILVVNPALPVKSVKELIALAKSKPGELNYASGGTGSSPHLAAELFKALADVDIVRIPYKGSGPALKDLIGGQV
jgi:tripartite-type tricarboxylate transporter receptor subunit TctC